MPNPFLPRLPLGAGRRLPRLARAVAQAETALVRLAPLLEAQVDAHAERGHGAAGAWALLCQVEALLANLQAERAAGAVAPPGGAEDAPGRPR
jgi:hypothetical protein